MDRLGLSVADFNVYLDHLRSPSVGVSVKARLLDMEFNPLETMPGVTGGTLNVDTTQTDRPARNATVVMSDPGHAMDWDTNSPGASPASPIRQIRLEHITYVPALGRRVTCPLITGPVRGFSRKGSEISLKIVGRDDLMQGKAWRPRSYAKGMLKTDVIKDLLRFYGGNVNLAGIPDLPYRLPTALSVGKQSVAWTIVQSVAASINRQLYFDGRGNPLMRLTPTHSCIGIYEGDHDTHKSDLMGEASVDWDMDGDWFNLAEVTGEKPEIYAASAPPPHHVMHPQNMGSNGSWYVQPKQETNSKIRTDVEAKKRADQLMSQQLVQAAKVTAISKCFPFLHELDVVGLQQASGHTPFALRNFSIDLGGVGMSLGYNRRFHVLASPRPSKAVK